MYHGRLKANIIFTGLVKMVIQLQNIKLKKTTMRTRICKRCERPYEDVGKFSRICPRCRKPGGTQKIKNDKE